MKLLNYQGRMINPLNIQPEDLQNVGMQCAVTLSRVQRFWGQCRISYTVAQHSLAMVEIFRGLPELQKWAIAHEVYEALTGIDLPSPLKHNDAYKPYRDAEIHTLKLFAEEYNLVQPLPDAIKKADAGLLVMEAEALMPYSAEVNWRDYGDPMGALYRLGASEEEIRSDFLEKWNLLFGKL